MAKNRSSGVTVMTGKTLENLINLQLSTQDVLNKITESMKDAADKKSSDVQIQLLSIQQKLLDVNLDNFKLNKRSYERQSATFDNLAKGMKDWKTWGDKLKDIKAGAEKATSIDVIQTKLLKNLNIGGIFNKKLLELDFKKTAKATGQADGMSRKELAEAASTFATNTITAMRQNEKIEKLKKTTGKDEKFLRETPVGMELYGARDSAAAEAAKLQKSPKDALNKMGGNTSGSSVPLKPAEANPLTDLPTASSKEGQLEQASMFQQQTEFLQRIADNTSLMAGKDQEGNKKQDDNIVEANGVKTEFDIAIDAKHIVIPVGCTGYMAQKLWEQINLNIEEYYGKVNDEVRKTFQSLNTKMSNDEIVSNIVKLIKLLRR